MELIYGLAFGTVLTVVLYYKVKKVIVATFEDVRAEYKAYTASETARADVAEAALADKTAVAQQLAEDLQKFQDDDTATDAQQLADKAQQLADDLGSDLQALKDARQPAPEEPAEPEVPVEEPVEEVPAEEV